MKKVIFAGTPDFAVPCLQTLFDMPSIDLQAVYTQPDRPKGRGQQRQASPVKVLAEQLGLPIRQPEKLNVEDEKAYLRDCAPDMLVVVAYGQLLSAEILAIPKHGCLNVHASLLPRWRGAAPIHRAIEAGDEQTGVCLMKMEVGLDTGPVYASKSLAINSAINTPQLHDELSQLGATLLRDALPDILSGETSSIEQSESKATYAHKLQKTESVIDWSESAAVISRKIRAFQPWPGAQTTWNNEPLKLWTAQVIESQDQDAAPGKVIAASKDGITVQCGDGCLVVSQLQPAGKAKMSAEAFLSSREMVGTSLS